MKQAIDAISKAVRMSLREEVSMLMQGDYIDKYLGKENELRDILEQVTGNRIIEEIKDFKDVYYVSRDGEVLTVWEDGTIEDGKMVWTGNVAGSFSNIDEENKIINIENGEELKLLSNKVNSGEKYDNYEININKHIDMGARPDGENWNNEENNAVNWVSIGSTLENQLMCKTINGNNKIIRGLYSKSTEKYMGLFGNVSGNVKNFIVKDSYLEGATGIAAIVGTLRSGSLENCKNINTTIVLIEGEYQGCGGIVGQAVDNSKIINCENRGNIFGNGKKIEYGDNYAGGIIGWIDTITLKNSYNVGNVEKNQFSGGIVGKNRTGTIENTFMLDTTCDKIVGENENPIKQEVEVKNADYFRSNSILEVLGNEIWEIVGAKNNGYPVLK